MTPPADGLAARPFRGLEHAALALGLTLVAAWIWHMFPVWRSDPDLSHGMLTPVLFVILVHEARTRGTPRYLDASPTAWVVISLVCAGSLLLLFAGGLYAAALDWSHSFVQSALAAAFCALLTAAWLVCALRGSARIPFNWPAAAAILIWALSAPIPPGTYTRLTQALQGAVTSGVLTTLHLLGIAALKNGNVIELPHVSVGVEEACSGIRSLISCVFAAVFITGVMVRGGLRRAVILLLAAPIAVAMNFVRSLLLTLLAERGVDITGGWHDATGFGVLLATGAILCGLAWMLGRAPKATGAAETDDGHTATNPADPRRAARPLAAEATLVITLFIACITVVSFVVQTRPNPRHETPPPPLALLLPATAAGWTVETRDDLYRFSSQLQTQWLAERTYRRDTAGGGSVQLTVYLAYWPGGQAPVSLVASHTPEACWPGGGWVEEPRSYKQIALRAGQLTLPRAEHRVFTFEGYPQQVWYWHLYDGRPIHHEGVGSPWKLLSLAWHYGFRNDGAQLFVRISSNRAWEEIASEPILREILSNLREVGLKEQN